MNLIQIIEHNWTIGTEIMNSKSIGYDVDFRPDYNGVRLTVRYYDSTKCEFYTKTTLIRPDDYNEDWVVNVIKWSITEIEKDLNQ